MTDTLASHLLAIGPPPFKPRARLEPDGMWWVHGDEISSSGATLALAYEWWRCAWGSKQLDFLR
jgi:hypothetical protein